MLSFEPGSVVLTIGDVTQVRDNNSGVLGIIKKINPDMGLYASRFALSNADLIAEGKFKSVNSAGNSLFEMLRLAFGGREPGYLLPDGHVLAKLLGVEQISIMSDEEIIALVSASNS